MRRPRSQAACDVRPAGVLSSRPRFVHDPATIRADPTRAWRSGLGVSSRMHRFRVRSGVLLAAIVVALVATASVAVSIATSSGQATKAITPSPVYSDAEVNKPAGDNREAYYGNLLGQRYSSLKQINTSNVANLKEVWHISLGSCTAGLIAGDPVIPGAPRGATNNPTNCGSMESNPVAIDGVLYT